LHQWPFLSPRDAMVDFADAAFLMLRARAAQNHNGWVGL
jgi:hypothetical protein